MDSAPSLKLLLSSQFHTVYQAFQLIIPKLLVFALVIFVGWIFATVCAQLILRTSSLSERIFSRFSYYSRFVTTKKEKTNITRLFSSLCYWLVFIFFLLIAVKTLQVGELDIWMNKLFESTPYLVIAGFIIFCGYLLSQATEKTILNVDKLVYKNVLAKSARYLILLLSFIIAIEQLDIEITLLENLILLSLGLILSGFALSFALTLHSVAFPVIRFKLHTRSLSVGEYIQIDDIQGEIISINHASITLFEDDKSTLISLDTVLSQPIEILTKAAK